MSGYQDEAIASPAQDYVPIGSLIGGTVVACVSGALIGVVFSFLVWRSVWWELVLALAALPVLILWLGMTGFAIRGAISYILVPREEEQLDQAQPERMRLVPVRSSLVVNGCDSRDLAYFTKAALGAGDWTQKRWRGTTMPSGRKCDNGYHAALVACLSKAGIITDQGPRSSGDLAVRDVQQALHLLGVNDLN
jgi:hypothetical protein